MGEKIGFINQMTAFFNAQIQGGDKIYREAKNNPMSLIVRGLGLITFPTIYFWYQNKDKEWFQKLPSDLKYSHLYIDTSDFSDKEDIISLPLPHELGTLFGGISMAYLDEEYEQNPTVSFRSKIKEFMKWLMDIFQDLSKYIIGKNLVIAPGMLDNVNRLSDLAKVLNTSDLQFNVERAIREDRKVRFNLSLTDIILMFPYLTSGVSI